MASDFTETEQIDFQTTKRLTQFACVQCRWLGRVQPRETQNAAFLI